MKFVINKSQVKKEKLNYATLCYALKHNVMLQEATIATECYPTHIIVTVLSYTKLKIKLN